MWTPKRIVLLAVGVVLFVSAYLVYGRSLGGIDGLPPLPEDYWPSLGEELSPTPVKRSIVEERLRQAFGQACEELDRPLKLELQSKRMVLAARDFKLVNENDEVEESGKEVRCLRLDKLSLALYSENKGDGRGVEINTIKANVGYLTFDRPITFASDAGNRKIVSAKLRGNIEIVNNRRTPDDRSDDLVLMIPSSTASLHYDEARHLVWTDDVIELKDFQSKPDPIQINGTGMEMELIAETPQTKTGAPAPRKPKGESVTGVKKITLRSGVVMQLYSAGQFLGGAKKEQREGRTAADPAESPEKAHVTIKCPGRFQYDFLKEGDLAQFDLPVSDPSNPNTGARGVGTKHVEVTRHQIKLQQWDQLFCQHLELRLRRKEAPQGGRGAGAADRGLDIETAHATGESVTLTSDAEQLDAHGNDFTFDARTATTILKGSPEMWARKNGSEIHARELYLQEQKVEGPDKTVKSYQKATAIGPGYIEMIEKAENAGAGKGEKKATRAEWDDKLISSKDGPYDLLILTGKMDRARFFDREHDQSLQADTLKVWLKASAQEEEERGQSALPGQGRKPEPRKIEAIGHVKSQSSELNINQNNHLIIEFEDVPVENVLPAPAAVKAEEEKRRGGIASAPPIPAPPEVSPADKPKDASATKAAEPPRPINLEAHTVQAWVRRAGEKTTLRKLWTEGRVHVQQGPAKPDEKGLDIRGETLEMDYHPDGNFLKVRGGDERDNEDIAKLVMNTMVILGREVNIDQAANKAWVTGAGAMTMVSETDFQGSKLAKPVPLNIAWSKSMLFQSNYALYTGGVVADQDKSLMQCEELQVNFDRYISLKEGMKNDQPARVQTLICNHNVEIQDRKTDAKDNLINYQLIKSQSLTMTSRDEADRKPNQPSEGNDVDATGPGLVCTYQKSSDPPPQPNAKKPAPAPKNSDDEMKLTYVLYQLRLHANNKNNKATFYNGVRVLILPFPPSRVPLRERIEKIDIDLLQVDVPAGGMYLQCNQLQVGSTSAGGDKKYQWMEAKTKVTVRSREFYGSAEVLTYTEEDNKIIFTGTDGAPATLFKRKPNGSWDNGMSGRKIIYNRITGEASIVGGDTIFGGSR